MLVNDLLDVVSQYDPIYFYRVNDSKEIPVFEGSIDEIPKEILAKQVRYIGARNDGGSFGYLLKVKID